MRVYILALVILLFTGCSDEKKSYTPTYSEEPPLKKDIYLFAVHPLHNPQRLFDVYGPMIDYINARLDHAQLRLEASRNYASFDKKLSNAKFHFALPNPYQSVMATKHGYDIFGKMADDDNFRGIILLRKDSDIKTVKDLKGKKISYPAPTALAATMMPQWFLYEHGLNINKDVENLYVGSQESSIMSVYLGKSAAASTWPPPWEAFIKERPEIAKEVMIKWETPSLPNNGLVVRDDVNKTLLKQVADAIFSLDKNDEGRKILQAMELSRFEEANITTYKPVIDFLEKFEKELRPIRESND